MQTYQELELAVGDTIFFQNRTLTLLDTEDGLGLFQLDAEEQYRPITVDSFLGTESMDCSV